VQYGKKISAAVLATALIMIGGIWSAPAAASKPQTPRAAVDNSTYRGLWFNEKDEHIRRCIIRRESNGLYDAVSRTGKYRGAYQMSPELGVGVTWMMQPEVREELGTEGLELMRKLRVTPVNKWDPYWQDRAFWTVWRYGKGKHHWDSTRNRC
jgi:hypothetical protein